MKTTTHQIDLPGETYILDLGAIKRGVAELDAIELELPKPRRRASAPRIKRTIRKPGHRFQTLPFYGSHSVGAVVLSGPEGGRYRVMLDGAHNETTVPAWEIE